MSGADHCAGSDATAHMSEEVKDAGRYVPIAIAWGYFVSLHPVNYESQQRADHAIGLAKRSTVYWLS